MPVHTLADWTAALCLASSAAAASAADREASSCWALLAALASTTANSDLSRCSGAGERSQKGEGKGT